MKSEKLKPTEGCDLGVYRVERDGRPAFRVLAYTRKSAEEVARRMLGGPKACEGPLVIFLDEAYP